MPPRSATGQPATPGNPALKPNEFDRLTAAELRKLLNDHNVPFDPDLRKPDLHQLVQQGSNAMLAVASALQKQKLKEGIERRAEKTKREEETMNGVNGGQERVFVLKDVAKLDTSGSRGSFNTAITPREQNNKEATGTLGCKNVEGIIKIRDEGNAKKARVKGPLKVRNDLCVKALLERRFEWPKPEPDDVFCRVKPAEGKTLAQTLKAGFEKLRKQADSDLEQQVMEALKPWEDKMKLRVAMQLNLRLGQWPAKSMPKDVDSANDMFKIAYRYIWDKDNDARASQDTEMMDPDRVDDEQPIDRGPRDAVKEWWIEVQQIWDELADQEKTRRLRHVEESWTVWTSSNRFFVSLRNRYASQAFGILRAPPPASMYVAFDKNDLLVVFLYPGALSNAYGKEVVDRMTTDTRLMHDDLRTVSLGNDNRRWVSHQIHLEESQGTLRRSDISGTDYYGCWHQQAHPNYPIIEMSDGWRKSDGGGVDTNYRRQCLLQFLRHTDGTITKLIDFWFEVWEPELFHRYQAVYDGVSDFAKLPPTNKNSPETFCYRALLVNRHTDEHSDSKDWRKGLAALVELGDLEGAAMCFNQLGLKLPGYRPGSLLLIRGSEIRHYTSPWKGTGPKRGDRYVFLHGTHESVRAAIENPRVKDTQPGDVKEIGGQEVYELEDSSMDAISSAGRERKEYPQEEKTGIFELADTSVDAVENRRMKVGTASSLGKRKRE